METALRQRMIEDMRLVAFAKRTQEAYVRAVRQLADYYHKSPEKITEEELREYFLYMKDVKKYTRGTMTIALYGIKFFYEKTLGVDWNIRGLVRTPRQKTMPLVLSTEEVREILDLVTPDWSRVCLSTIYSCGLRLPEGTHLQVSDMDGQRGFVHINGKRSKERYVPLPIHTLKMLRIFRKSHRNPIWLFPAPGRGGNEMPVSKRPLPDSRVQGAFRRALKRTNIKKKACMHPLRHSYATHLLEMGINLRQIQENLGHNSPKTTPKIIACNYLVELRFTLISLQKANKTHLKS